MKLSQQALKLPSLQGKVVLPKENAFSLPEKVLQFGTGVLLRGLPDFLINKANNEGFFNGRIVIVKSTNGGGDAEVYNEQDGLYTLCIRGIEEKQKVDEIHISASVSRVLTAATEWDEIMLCAENPDMQVIISNTTEVGITFTNDNIHATPPSSFPGKLLAFLYHRFKFFNKDVTKGMVIVPTELVPNNADKLLSIVIELAHQNGLETSFIDWLENANHFCNSLVDRIVPGKLSASEQSQLQKELGYEDGLMIMSEVYALWAIQANNDEVKNILSFADANESVVIAKDINKFRELKLRLLNGSHTFTCGLAFLAGFDTVKDAMENADFAQFIQQLMFDEIVPSIISDAITETEAINFANKVLDRYRNAFIDHHWISITAQYSSKMHLRNTAVIQQYHQRFAEVPSLMALGMAAHILFMCGEQVIDGKYYGTVNGKKYLITDANAALYASSWKDFGATMIVNTILSNNDLWQTDLNTIAGFSQEVNYWLQILIENGAVAAIKLAVATNNLVEHEK